MAKPERGAVQPTSASNKTLGGFSSTAKSPPSRAGEAQAVPARLRLRNRPASQKTTGGGSSSAARTSEIPNCTTAGCGIAAAARSTLRSTPLPSKPTAVLRSTPQYSTVRRSLQATYLPTAGDSVTEGTGVETHMHAQRPGLQHSEGRSFRTASMRDGGPTPALDRYEAVEGRTACRETAQGVALARPGSRRASAACQKPGNFRCERGCVPPTISARYCTGMEL
jgi:hypothetical protein